MKLTKSLEKLIKDATDAGYTAHIGDTFFTLNKYRNQRVTRGICFCEIGKAYRTDIEFSSTVWINTQKEIRKVLGI